MGLLCDMQLDNRTGVYQPGQMITGRLMVTLGEPTLLKALGLKISGYASTQWEKPQKQKKRKYNETSSQPLEQSKNKQIFYTYREDYLSTYNYYIGSDMALPKVVATGAYHFLFSARLPDNCPSTFDSATGRIRYELDVEVDYPDYKHVCYSRPIHVKKPYDLSQHAVALQQPNNFECVEKKSFMKFWQRPLELYVAIPQRGYVPGETIQVHVKVVNHNVIRLTEVIYKLNLIATYTGRHKKKTTFSVERVNLVNHIHSLFGQNGTIVQHLEMLPVPETPPTMLVADCKCIQIGYEVEIFVKSANKKRTVQAFVPLTIGTVSLGTMNYSMPPPTINGPSMMLMSRSMDDLALESQSLREPAEFAASAPMEPSDTNYQRASFSSVPLSTSASMSSLPTSFREADFMTTANLNKDNKHADKSAFKPKYLYYDINNLIQETQDQKYDEKTN